MVSREESFNTIWTFKTSSRNPPQPLPEPSLLFGIDNFKMIIIQELLSGSNFLNALNFLRDHQFKFSSTIKPQMIFPSFPTSLALSIEFIREDSAFENVLIRLSEIQRGFRHCIGIIVAREIRHYDKLNLHLKGGMLRLYYASDQESCIGIVTAIYEEFSSKDALQRLKAQYEYFENEKDALRSQTLALKVYRTALQSLGITSEDDIAILTDGFPTLNKLISADLDTLIASSPVSLESLQRINEFFRASEPSEPESGLPRSEAKPNLTPEYTLNKLLRESERVTEYELECAPCWLDDADIS